MEVRVAGRRQAVARDALPDQEPHDARGARGRKLPVRREDRAGDRHRVGMPLDHHLVDALLAQDLRDLREHRGGCGLQLGETGVEQDPVGEQPDHEAALGDHGLQLALDALLTRVLVDLPLEALEVLLLPGAGRGERRRRGGLADERRDRRDRRGGGRRAHGLRVGARVANRLAAGQDLAREGLLKRLREDLELRLVHRCDAEEHHEERHQQRDHVRVREEPALLVLVLGSGSPPPSSLCPARTHGWTQAAASSGSTAARPSASAGEPSVVRSSGGMKDRSLSATTRGLSPAWIERMPSRVIVRSSVSSDDIAFSLLAVGRKTTFAEPTPYSVAMKAPEIAGPRVAGASRFSSTCTRPMTVPMMPIVGEKPPAFSNGITAAWWRPIMPSISFSRISRTSSGSVPSTTSCRPLRVKSSSSWATSSSSARRPSRRARSAKPTSSSSCAFMSGLSPLMAFL